MRQLRWYNYGSGFTAFVTYIVILAVVVFSVLVFLASPHLFLALLVLLILCKLAIK